MMIKIISCLQLEQGSESCTMRYSLDAIRFLTPSLLRQAGDSRRPCSNRHDRGFSA